MNELLNQLIQLDGNILLLIQTYVRLDILSPFVVFFTKLGNYGFIWIVISISLLFPKETRKFGVMALIALACNYCLCNLLLKPYVARIRPYEVIPGLYNLITESDASFPSGHAASAFAAAMVIFKGTEKHIGIPVLVLAIAISFSRLYVGVHYPSDVLAGVAIGAIVGFLVYSIGSWIAGGDL